MNITENPDQLILVVDNSIRKSFHSPSEILNMDRSNCPDCYCDMEHYYDGQDSLKYYCDNCDSGISFYDSEDTEE